MVIALIAYIYLSSRHTEKSEVAEVEPPPPTVKEEPKPIKSFEPKPVAVQPSSTAAPMTMPAPKPKVVGDNSKTKKLALRYKIVDGMYIVQGDIMAGGIVPGDNPPPDGRVELDPLQLWGNVIPYHIQPDVVNPGRIQDAIKMFEGTAVQFVPENGQSDVLVFVQGDKNCYSYLGKSVGKQPILISPQCRADDIAHEILHALGFMHEQNRADRDDFVQVFPENIEDEFQINFEKLPQEFMKVSGLGTFDYQSLMMYPPWMFAKGGRSTMEPKQRDKQIAPMPRLSPGDLDRLNRAYRQGVVR